MIEDTVHFGRSAITVSNDRYTAVVTTEGPLRVFGFRRIDGPSLFVELPELTVSSGTGTYPILGGHRLWIAPENPDTTYAAEASGSVVVEHDDGIGLVAAADAIGLVKSIRIRVGNAGFVVEHAVTNAGDEPIELAPLAIPQLLPGGLGYLTLDLAPSDPHGLQASDRIVVWPYTEPGELRFERNRVIVTAERVGPTKVGVGMTGGWLAYRFEDELFVKRSQKGSGTYLDQGAAGQCYCNELFLELETLGPVVGLEPGLSTSHSETWNSYDVSGLDDRRIAERMES
ncbi:MAG: hypothetical protein KJN81_10610 [Acidimicrobiia bacterium]|nr:hypothetical protein [Acidimicrobiia bacterium]NNL28866.1 hypothetical protein [Acidimicrobiia bacterium]